jgi:5-formyltetrahydrofolate cyclo-ligase
MAGDAALRASKRTLRQTVLARRNALTPEARAAWSQAIFARVLPLAAASRVRAVLAYHAFGSEPDTVPFLRALLAGGHSLLLPRIDRPARVLMIHRVGDLERDLVLGPWGIREPDPRRCPPARAGDANFVLVPGVAFDPGGGRLGYGGGYYDRLLATCAEGTPLVAAAFEAQMVDHVPTGASDRRVGMVVTERGVYGPSAGDAEETRWRST